MVIPLIIKWFHLHDSNSKAGDIFVIGHACWAGLALLAVSGFSSVDSIGVYGIDVIGAYLMGRILVETDEDFRKICAVMVTCIGLTIPLAAFEAITNTNIFIDALGPLTVERIEHEMRLGLYRAQSVFGHQILYGIIAATPLCLTHYVLGYRRGFLRQALLAWVPVTAGFLSLSSAAFSIFLAQGMIVAWDKVTKAFKFRWWMLLCLFGVFYVAIDLLSNRTPLVVFISYFSLNPGNAYTRILQFDYSIDDIIRNPLFGIGFNEFDKPYWLVASIDNFWLVIALRYGIPGFLLLLIGYLLVLKEAMGRELGDERMASYRLGYCIMLVTSALVMLSVHLWDEALYYFLFLLGAHGWIGRASAGRGPPPVGNDAIARSLGDYTKRIDARKPGALVPYQFNRAGEWLGPQVGVCMEGVSRLAQASRSGPIVAAPVAARTAHIEFRTASRKAGRAFSARFQRSAT